MFQSLSSPKPGLKPSPGAYTLPRPKVQGHGVPCPVPSPSGPGQWECCTLEGSVCQGQEGPMAEGGERVSPRLHFGQSYPDPHCRPSPLRREERWQVLSIRPLSPQLLGVHCCLSYVDEKFIIKARKCSKPRKGLIQPPSSQAGLPSCPSQNLSKQYHVPLWSVSPQLPPSPVPQPASGSDFRPLCSYSNWPPSTSLLPRMLHSQLYKPCAPRALELGCLLLPPSPQRTCFHL